MVERKILNPKTGRYVNYNGVLGKKIRQNKMIGGDKCGWLCQKAKAAKEKAKKMTKKAKQMNVKKCGCNCNVEVPIIIKGTLTPFILKWDCNQLFDINPSNKSTFAEHLEKNTGIKITDKDGKALKNLDCMKLIDQLKSKIKLEKKGDEIVLLIGKAKTIIPKLWIKNMNKFGIKYKDLLLALDSFKCTGNFNVPCEKNQNIKNTNSCVSNKKKQKGGADYPASFKKQPYGGGRKKSARKNKQGRKKSGKKNKQKAGFNYEYPGKELSGKGWPYQRTDFPYKVGTNLDEKYLF